MRPEADPEADAEADALLVDALQGAVCAAREPAEVLCSRENGAARMGLVRMDQPELLSSAIRSDRCTATGTALCVRGDVEQEAIRWRDAAEQKASSVRHRPKHLPLLTHEGRGMQN